MVQDSRLFIHSLLFGAISGKVDMYRIYDSVLVHFVIGLVLL